MHSRETVFRTRRTAIHAEYTAARANVWADTVKQGRDGSDPTYRAKLSHLYATYLRHDDSLCRENKHGPFGYCPSF